MPVVITCKYYLQLSQSSSVTPILILILLLVCHKHTSHLCDSSFIPTLRQYDHFNHNNCTWVNFTKYGGPCTSAHTLACPCHCVTLDTHGVTPHVYLILDSPCHNIDISVQLVSVNTIILQMLTLALHQLSYDKSYGYIIPEFFIKPSTN